MESGNIYSERFYNLILVVQGFQNIILKEGTSIQHELNGSVNNFFSSSLVRSDKQKSV